MGQAGDPEVASRCPGFAWLISPQNASKTFIPRRSARLGRGQPGPVSSSEAQGVVNLFCEHPKIIPVSLQFESGVEQGEGAQVTEFIDLAA